MPLLQYLNPEGCHVIPVEAPLTIFAPVRAMLCLLI
jgi:hypothetical protein